MANSRPAGSALRRHRLAQFEQVVAAIENGDPAELVADSKAKLEALNLLVATEAALARRRRGLVFAAVVSFVAFAIAIAWLFKEPLATVVLRADSSAVSFRMAVSEAITPSIEVAQFTAVQGAVAERPRELAGLPNASFSLSSAGGALRLEPLRAEAGTWIALSRIAANRYRLRLTPPESAPRVGLAVAVAGAIRVGPDMTRRVESIQHLTLEPVDGALVVEFITPAEQLTNPVSADGLRLMQDTLSLGHRRVASSILEGVVEFVDYQDRQIGLRRSDYVDLEGIAGVIDGLRAGRSTSGEHSVKVQWSGTVTGVRIGRGAERPDQMPRRLDRVTRSREVVVLCGAIGAFLGIAFSAWTWLRDTQ